MWLSGGNRPDFRTINDFRGQRMKDVIDEVFAEVLLYLLEAGHVKLEHYFADGTKIAADANQHKVVWAKRTQRYQQRVREQIGDLLAQIEQVNAAEQAEYGEADLEERGPAGGGELDSGQLRARIAQLNQRLCARQLPQPEAQATAKALKKLLATRILSSDGTAVYQTAKMTTGRLNLILATHGEESLKATYRATAILNLLPFDQALKIYNQLA
jgi:hypothetical protein